MAHSHVDAGGNRARLTELANAFGFKPSTFAKILKCDERAILPVAAVAKYLQSTEAFVIALLDGKDSAISSDDVGRLLHMSRPTVNKNVKPAAILPQGTERKIIAYSLREVEQMAQHQKGVAQFGEIEIEMPEEQPVPKPKTGRGKKK